MMDARGGAAGRESLCRRGVYLEPEGPGFNRQTLDLSRPVGTCETESRLDPDRRLTDKALMVIHGVQS